MSSGAPDRWPFPVDPVADRVRVRAFAKVNLTLHITGVRADGFHRLHTIFQSLTLHDTLVCRRVAGAFRLSSDDPACPDGPGNLVWRAAEHVWAASGRRGAMRGAAVRIVKRIPMQAGLGGGSSDAAAALRAFAALWRVRLPMPRLQAIAASLGADVPYFLEGGTALGVGRGDRIVPLPDLAPRWVVLVVPPFGISTRDAFTWWDEDFRRGRASVLESEARPRSSAGRLPSVQANDLQPVAEARHPDITRIVSRLRSAGAEQAAMSGSGSAVFGLFRSRRAARLAATDRRPHADAWSGGVRSRGVTGGAHAGTATESLGPLEALAPRSSEPTSVRPRLARDQPIV
jgi:4-diphosphocytidyl-2-C-methyl-D-erythritol kinase